MTFHSDLTLKNVVCLTSFKVNLFTCGAIDNIDKNSSSTAQQSFHGTGISIIQNRSNKEEGNERSYNNLKISDIKRQLHIPLPTYTNMMPVAMRNDKPSYPKYELPNEISMHDKFNITELKEYEWLCHQLTETKSRAAFFSTGDIIECTESIISMLPLFQEDSKSVSMIKHALNLVMNCINFLNPFQTPAAVLDQPLFALAKKIQWTWPGEMGEDHLVVLMGGLHIEMVMLEILGDWLQESGWTVVLKKANLNNPGVVESFLSDSHVKRSRYAHKVTACSLYILLNMAFTEQNEYEDMKTFISERCSKYPLFKYWYITLESEVLLLSFVRSFRERNFDLYICENFETELFSLFKTIHCIANSRS